jgi:CheY-like chemotaxis protein
MTINSDTALKAPKMLIADDDPAIVQMLANRCLKMGFKVDTASNGMQLLIKARQWKPDVLIVDVNMPEMDGLSVCTKLLEPRGISVDVVVVTGYTDPETIERCESFGAFYARKGPDFWIRIRAALEELFPHRRSQAPSSSTISYQTATQSTFCIDCAAHWRPRGSLSS